VKQLPSPQIHFLADDPVSPDGRGGYVYGYKLLQLPDALQNPVLLSESDHQRLQEHWQRWVSFVGSFWRDRGDVTVALRTAYNPDTGMVEFWFLGKFRPAGKAHIVFDPSVAAFAALPASDLGFFLQMHGCQAVPLTEAEIVEVRRDMDTAASEGSFSAYSVCQAEYESLIRLRSGSSTNEDLPPDFIQEESSHCRKVYGMRLFQGPIGGFDLAVRAMALQKTKVEVWVLAQGTKLRDSESMLLAAMAREAEAVSKEVAMGASLQGVAVGAQQAKSDPLLQQVGSEWHQTLKRLTHRPFLHAAIVISQDRVSAWKVSRALAANLMTEPVDDPNGQKFSYPVVSHRLEPDLAACICRDLDLDWLEDEGMNHLAKSPSLRRLRALTDSIGLATVLRLPASAGSGLPGVKVVQSPPAFHPGPLEPGKSQEIELGLLPDGTPLGVTLRDFNKHALITGFTGSGKTKTILTILHQLWIDHNVPFLVIESAKSEYRGLKDVKDFAAKGPRVRIYTVGNESCAPLRLNPFQLIPGISVESHIGRLQTCFEAAIPPIGPVSSVISEALIQTYRSKGWMLTDRMGEVKPLAPQAAARSFPTMAEFVNEVEATLTRRKYAGDVGDNMRAAIVGRLKPLVMGAKGFLFSSQVANPPFQELFEIPTIIELNEINIEDKALVAMILVTLLREYREVQKRRGSGLRHVTVLEEAHNILEEVASSGGGEGAGSDVRYKSVQAFCAMLTEIRALGEGLIIADQSPQKLAQDAIRNTNVQIAHQLRDSEDRDAVARAMIMDERQRDFLAKLHPGSAAVFVTGLEKATFVEIPPYVLEPHMKVRIGKTRGKGYTELVDDSDVRSYMDLQDPRLETVRTRDYPYDGCSLCKVRDTCDFRSLAFGISRSESRLVRVCKEVFDQKSTRMPQELMQTVRSALKRVDCRHEEAAWCLLLHVSQLASNGVDSEVKRTAEVSPASLRTALDKHSAK
jgi:hypothetical protein